MRIGSFMPKNSIWAERFSALGARFPEHEFLHGLAPDAKEAGSLDIIVSGALPKSAYLASTRLKAVFQPFTGINHLPAEELRARSVRVFNVHSNASAVAERALAMTLAFYGRIVEYHNDLKKAVWHGYWVKGGSEDSWESIEDKTCAILGAGAIGTALAGYLKAFGCTTIGWRRRHGAPPPPHFDSMVPDMAEAVRMADIVYVTLPATAETEGLITKDMLLGMKGKFLVNVGRGSIVDEEGLYQALATGILRGAAIDTWYAYPREGKEGAPSRYPIHLLDNVILSPHVGGSTKQATRRAVDETVRNLTDFLLTGNSKWEVDLAAMY